MRSLAREQESFPQNASTVSECGNIPTYERPIAMLRRYCQGARGIDRGGSIVLADGHLPVCPDGKTDGEMGVAELLALSGLRSPYLGKLGVIEEGAVADLLLVDGDPIALSS
jgi:hypothetical protein